MSRREAEAARGENVARRARSHGEEDVSRRARSHGALLWLALLYTLFVIYGSLVPLDYRAMSLDEAVRQFRGIRWLDLGIGSRADWVANVLLFVPLAFLWLGVLWHRRSIALRLLATLVTWSGVALLSFCIEFTQLFFPPRTVSQNDLLAEVIGGVIGLLAWWTVGPRLLRWLADWLRGHGDWSLARRLLYAYLAGLFTYNLLPLDLTISPVEVFHKLQEGRLLLLPFAALPTDPAMALYEVATDVAIWVPVGLLLRGTGVSMGRAVRNALLAALLLEFLQLWVFSRVSDVTDLFTAALGASGGTLLGARLAVAPASGASAPVRGRAVGIVSLLAAACWLGVLALVFWYPFDFDTKVPFLRERVAALQRAPFTAYYYGTEFRAVTEVLHKVLFFIPLGFLLGCGLTRFGLQRKWTWAIGLVVSAGAAAVIEGGQLALPGKNVDLTDWSLECLGAGLGIWLLLALLRPRALSGPRHAGEARSMQGVAQDDIRQRESREPGGPEYRAVPVARAGLAVLGYRHRCYRGCALVGNALFARSIGDAAQRRRGNRRHTSVPSRSCSESLRVTPRSPVSTPGWTGTAWACGIVRNFYTADAATVP